MPKFTVMPVIGEIHHDDRLGTLRGCHVVTDRSVSGTFNDPKQFEATLGRAIKELLLADRNIAALGRYNLIITIEE